MAEKKERVEAAVRKIRRVTLKKCSAEEKVRIVLEGLRCETCIAAPPRSRDIRVEQGVPRGGLATAGSRRRASVGQPPGDRDAGGARSGAMGLRLGQASS
jgi:hypothetical protein